MKRKYYSSRNNPKKLSLIQVFQKLKSLYVMLRNKDYFKDEAGITNSDVPEETLHEAMIVLDFQPHPIEEWEDTKITEDNVFDVIEYFFDNVSKPGEWIQMTSDTGYNFCDYDRYDKEAGSEEYREYANSFLYHYRDGYELTKDGKILSLGAHGVQNILLADLPILGEKNIDSKIQDAILKWRNRQIKLHERREAVRELADVFEWLKKSDLLKGILSSKDESMLFNIANNFAIRHHNPKQNQEYDKSIWYSWMFHFYLATFHAVSRMIAKRNNDSKRII